MAADRIRDNLKRVVDKTTENWAQSNADESSTTTQGSAAPLPLDRRRVRDHVVKAKGRSQPLHQREHQGQ